LSRLDPFSVSPFSYAAVGLDSSAVFDTIFKAVAVAVAMHVMVVPACDVGMVPAYCLCVCGGGGGCTALVHRCGLHREEAGQASVVDSELNSGSFVLAGLIMLCMRLPACMLVVV
jgi:hypothetical protein